MFAGITLGKLLVHAIPGIYEPAVFGESGKNFGWSSL